MVWEDGPLRLLSDGLSSLNVLDRHFGVEQVDGVNQTWGVNQAWGGDITFIPVRGGWLSLAVVLDVKSRKVIGWSLSQSLEQPIVVQALVMAQKARLSGPTEGTLLFHALLQ